MSRIIKLAMAVSLLSASAAVAQQEVEYSGGGGGSWNVQSGNTVGAGNTVLHAQFGWPGISATLLHGVGSKLDIGGRFTFNYGYEGIVTGIVPGLKLQFVLRVGIIEKSKFNFGLRFEPGFVSYFAGGGAQVGFAMPVGFDFGIPVNSALSVNLNLDLPMVVLFNTGFGGSGFFGFPVLFGGGLEWKLDPSMALTFDTRMGPFIAAPGGASFAFKFLFGLAFRF